MANWAPSLVQLRIKLSLQVFAISFALACSVLWAWPQERPNSSQTPSAPAAASLETPSAKSSSHLLPEATPVKLKLLHSLNSKTVVEDDPLNFALAEDVVINDTVMAQAGAVAIGRVRHAKAARALGRGAQLALEMQYLKVGHLRVPLRGSQERAGDNKKGATVAFTVLFGVSGLIKHGSEIEVKEGSIFTAYVDQDTDLPARAEAAPQ